MEPTPVGTETETAGEPESVGGLGARREANPRLARIAAILRPADPDETPLSEAEIKYLAMDRSLT